MEQQPFKCFLFVILLNIDGLQHMQHVDIGLLTVDQTLTLATNLLGAKSSTGQIRTNKGLHPTS